MAGVVEWCKGGEGAAAAKDNDVGRGEAAAMQGGVAGGWLEW